MRGFTILLAWTCGDDDDDAGSIKPEPEPEQGSEVADLEGLALVLEVLVGVTRILSSVPPSALLTPVPSQRIFRILLATSLVFAFGVDEEEEEEVLTARLRRCSLAVRRRYR